MFTYSLLENALEKALRKQEKQLKIKEKTNKSNWRALENKLNLINLFKMILITIKIAHHMKKIYLMNLLKKGLLNLKIWKKGLILIAWFISKKLKKETRKSLEIIKIW